MTNEKIQRSAHIFGLIITTPIFLLLNRVTDWHPISCALATMAAVVVITTAYVFFASFLGSFHEEDPDSDGTSAN